MIARTLSRRNFTVCAAAALTLLQAGPISTALATTRDEQLVHDAANRFLKIARTNGSKNDFASVLDEYVSTRSMALFVLGKHRRKLKAERKQEYLDLFNQMIISAATKHAGKVRGRAFVVTGTRGGIVQGYVQHSLDNRTGVEFRTRKNRITDIRVQGIWLAITLRQSFDQLMQQGNGNIEAIFRYLKSGKTP